MIRRIVCTNLIFYAPGAHSSCGGSRHSKARFRRARKIVQVALYGVAAKEMRNLKKNNCHNI